MRALLFLLVVAAIGIASLVGALHWEGLSW